MVKASIPIGIQPGTKLVHLQYDEEHRSWVLWVRHDPTLQHGTQLILGPDGDIERVIIRPDGSEERFRVR